MPMMPIPGPDDPLPAYYIRPDETCRVCRDYTQFDVSGIPHIPLMNVVLAPRDPSQTDAQWESTVRSTERYYLTLSIYRFLAHQLATRLGFHAGCRHGACRRARRCVTDRDEADWGFPGPWMPPCANTYNLVEQIREPIRALGRYIEAERGGKE